MDERLRQVYTDHRNPAGLSSIRKLYDEVKKDFPQLTYKYTQEWLSKQKPYSLLKPVKHKFKRNRVLVAGINEEFQADLLDVSNLSTSNKNYNFILTVIDVLSKYAFAIPIKNKSASAVAQAFEEIFAKRVPAVIQTDDGKEFKGAVSQLFSSRNILHIIARNATFKCSVVERFNKTLRLRIVRYMKQNNTRKYIDALSDMVKAYNATVHSATKMKPVDVTVANQQTAFDNLYNGKTYREMLLEAYRKKTVLKIGDFVRVKLDNKAFKRGYQDNWSKQLFRVSDVYNTGQKPMFKVVDATGKKFARKYYNEELQKIVPDLFEITLTGRKRTRQNTEEVEVTYTSGVAAWLPTINIFNDH